MSPAGESTLNRAVFWPARFPKGMLIPDYEPSSRRPIANLFRKTANSAVQMCVRANIHPDTISYLSVVASAATGVCFWVSGKVTEPDFAAVAASWMTNAGESGYFCCADFNRDDSVGMEDLIILADNWTTQGSNTCLFTSCPPPPVEFNN